MSTEVSEWLRERGHTAPCFTDDDIDLLWAEIQRLRVIEAPAQAVVDEPHWYNLPILIDKLEAALKPTGT
jgi:hypothetical protein